MEAENEQKTKVKKEVKSGEREIRKRQVLPFFDKWDVIIPFV